MSEQIKVLHVVGSMDRGGAEVMLMDIFRNISPRFKFYFLVNYKVKDGVSSGELDKEIIERGGVFKYIGTQWDIGPRKYFKQFKEIYEECGKPKIVHIHMNAKSGIIALAAKKAGATKVVVHSHANLKIRGSLVRRVLGEIELRFQKLLIARYSNQYWGCSQEAIDSLFYKSIQTNTVIINNAINVDTFLNIDTAEVQKFKQEYGITENTLILGNVGRIVRHKNVGFIIDLLFELNKDLSDFKFIFAGRAEDQVYLDEIVKKSEDYGIRNKVIYLGSRSDVALLYNVFDIFLGPALQEGFGLVAVEAQASGTPSILYKGFPGSVDMKLNLAIFLNDFNKSEWIKNILKMKDAKLENKVLIKDNIEKLGYDIKKNVDYIEKMYCN